VVRLRSRCARFVALRLLALGLSAAAAVAGQLATPRLEGRVTDLANLLSAEERREMTSTLARYEEETLHQIVVLTVPTLSGESIESFSLRVANDWGIGRKGIDDGILVTVAPKERKTRIELGCGMERFISNADAQRIIDDLMVPAFRKREYAAGLNRGLEELMEKARRFVVTRDDAEMSR
jgi:uncharacterized protein